MSTSKNTTPITKTPKPTQIIPGFKGFDKDLRCAAQGATPVQYKLGEAIEYEGPVEICKSGLHFCTNPLHLFRYYKPGKSRYASVEGSGNPQTHKDDSKIAVSRLFVKAEVTIRTLIEVGLKLIFEKVDFSGPSAASGDSSTGAASGDYSTGAASGDSSTGAASGNYSTGAASGYSSTGAASGDYSTGAASGYYSTGAASGDYSTGAASGYYCKASVSGKNSIAVANGLNSKAKGALGDYLVLTEYTPDGKELKQAKMTRVDGKKIKADVWYQLKAGKFVKSE